ncbi:hypothetical protein NQZ68_010279 [Dissostichus eleginoides]|nr:hypothetical protein NQZ68_010279 [Dissostichus eleginoides]
MDAEVIKLSIERYRLTGVEAGKTLSTWLNNRALRLRGLDALHSDDGRRGGAYELMSRRCGIDFEPQGDRSSNTITTFNLYSRTEK